MAPPKTTDPIIGSTKVPTFKPHAGPKMTTRHSGKAAAAASMLKKMNLKDLSKRKADQLSPPKGKTTKRSAFYDITNAATAANTAANTLAVRKTNSVAAKKATVKITTTAQPKLPTIMKITKPASTKSCKFLALF